MVKRKSYCCNCTAEFSSVAAMVTHYRKLHPDDGVGCYDQIGTVGDKFADSAIEQARIRTQHRADEAAAAESRLKQIEAFMPRFEASLRAFQAIQLSLDTFNATLAKK